MIVDRDVVHGGCGVGGSGFMMFAIFLVVLVVLIGGCGMWGNKHHDGHGFGAAEALGLAGLGKQCGISGAADMLAINRQANFIDPQTAILSRQQAVDTGFILNSLGQQNQEIIRAVDNNNLQFALQTCDLKQNQNRIALEGERLFNIRTLEDKNDKIADLRGKLAEANAVALQKETLATMCHQNCELNNRLTRIEDHMLKRPPYYASGGVPFVNQCVPGFGHGFGFGNGVGNGCCA